MTHLCSAANVLRSGAGQLRPPDGPLVCLLPLIKRNIHAVHRHSYRCPVYFFLGNLKCEKTHTKHREGTLLSGVGLSGPKSKYPSHSDVLGPHRVSQFLLAYLPKIKWSVKQSAPASASASHLRCPFG